MEEDALVIVNRALDILLSCGDPPPGGGDKEETAVSSSSQVRTDDEIMIERERVLRREQDEAFERSLAEDARKAEAEAAARSARQRDEEETHRKAEESRRRDEEIARETRHLLNVKARRLAAADDNPAPENNNSSRPLTLGFRFPSGARRALRFFATDPVSLVFDRLDVLFLGVDAERGEDDPRPGAYSLISPMAPMAAAVPHVLSSRDGDEEERNAVKKEAVRLGPETTTETESMMRMSLEDAGVREPQLLLVVPMSTSSSSS